MFVCDCLLSHRCLTCRSPRVLALQVSATEVVSTIPGASECLPRWLRAFHDRNLVDNMAAGSGLEEFDSAYREVRWSV